MAVAGHRRPRHLAWIEPGERLDLAGAALLGAASYRLLRGASRRTPIRAQAGYAAIALWSFLMTTAHGAGLMLLPALGPLCFAGTPAREITASGALVPTLAADRGAGPHRRVAIGAS